MNSTFRSIHLEHLEIVWNSEKFNIYILIFQNLASNECCWTFDRSKTKIKNYRLEARVFFLYSSECNLYYQFSKHLSLLEPRLFKIFLNYLPFLGRSLFLSLRALGINDIHLLNRFVNFLLFIFRMRSSSELKILPSSTRPRTVYRCLYNLKYIKEFLGKRR